MYRSTGSRGVYLDTLFVLSVHCTWILSEFPWSRFGSASLCPWGFIPCYHHGYVSATRLQGLRSVIHRLQVTEWWDRLLYKARARIDDGEVYS